MNKYSFNELLPRYTSRTDPILHGDLIGDLVDNNLFTLASFYNHTKTEQVSFLRGGDNKGASELGRVRISYIQLKIYALERLSCVNWRLQLVLSVDHHLCSFARYCNFLRKKETTVTYTAVTSVHAENCRVTANSQCAEMSSKN